MTAELSFVDLDLDDLRLLRPHPARHEGGSLAQPGPPGERQQLSVWHEISDVDLVPRQAFDRDLLGPLEVPQHHACGQRRPKRTGHPFEHPAAMPGRRFGPHRFRGRNAHGPLDRGQLRPSHQLAALPALDGHLPEQPGQHDRVDEGFAGGDKKRR